MATENLHARQRDILVNVTSGAVDAHSASRSAAYLNGYRKTISGQVIDYHSSHPDAVAALIVRAQSDVHSISWETDSLRNPSGEEFVTFIWLAGLERAGWGESKTGHPFVLSINGEKSFTFRNFKDSTATHWSIPGKNDARLTFEARTADKFGDLFGTMFLRVSAKLFAANVPLRLDVEGENANSPEWYMTFQYIFNFKPNLRAEPALFRRNGGDTQVLRVSLDNLAAGRNVEITGTDGARQSDSLKIGANIFQLPVPAVDSTRGLGLSYSVDGKLVSREVVEVHPVTRREVYLLSHSHNDIGYTDLQPLVERKQWHNIEEGLRLIEKTRDYPIEARFKWNIEILWPLESYLQKSSPPERQKVIDAIRSGSIGVNALYGNELTGLATSVEMSHFTDYARRFSNEYGIPISTALVSDIPGFTWGIVPALAQGGVRYFASGPNSGDRIGYVLQEWGDKPFWWVSQSGDERVLFWVAGAGYSTFHEGTLAKLGDEKMMKLMRHLDDVHYPYDMVQMPYTFGDNGPPDSTLSDFVRNWNSKYASPRLIISTHKEMFGEFERRYGAVLQERKGDFTPYWEDGALSTTYETVLNRRSVDRLVEGEAIWAMRAPHKYPKDSYGQAWRNVVLWDEHTWGAGNSVSDPDDPGVTGQWKIKRQYARSADSSSRALLLRAIAMPAQDGKARAIDVYNPTSWERSDIVRLPAGESSGGDRVTDASGRIVPSQRLTTGELAFKVVRLAPLSAGRYSISRGNGKATGSVNVSRFNIENQSLRISVDSATGAISDFRWRKDDIRFAGGKGLHQFLYVRGTNADSALPITHVRVSIGEPGGLVGSLRIEGDAPGCRSYISEIRLGDGREAAEIVTTIDKRSVREKEGMHIAFPFSISDAVVRYDVAGAIVRPEIDQLAGACKNFFSVQSWVDVSSPRYGVTLATPDVPLFELGEITAERPWLTTAQSSPTIYSYVMNNYWHTNYKADQEGVVTLRYFLKPHAGYRPQDAVRFGRECREELIAVAGDPSQPAVASLFHVEPENVLVSSVRPEDDGSTFLVQLYNPTNEAAKISIRRNTSSELKLTACDASGSPATTSAGGITIGAFGSAYVLVR